MVPIDDNSEKYILLSEVADKCSSLAEKWNCITGKGVAENHSLEDELINRALQQQLYLYCFMPISRISGKRWCFIWSDDLKGFLNPHATINCNLLLVNSKDRIHFDLLVNSHPRLMHVSRSDLYLNLDELAKLEKKGRYFVEMAMESSVLTEEEEKVEIDSTSGNPNVSKSTDSTKETSSVPVIGEHVDVQASKDASGSAFSSDPDSEIVTTTDTHLSLVSGIAQESHSIAQAEKPKRTKQPNKKKENTFPRNINEAVEPPLLSKDDRETLPLKTFADLQTRILSLEEIVSEKKKGRKGIFPFGKSTWYAGIKSGRFPKSYETTGDRRVGWRGSDIYALLQKMGMI